MIKFHNLVLKLLEEIEWAKEQEEEDKNLDSTDSILDTVNKSIEEFFFQNEIENVDIQEGGKPH